MVEIVDTDGVIAFRIAIESNIQQTELISVSHIEIYIFVEAESNENLSMLPFAKDYNTRFFSIDFSKTNGIRDYAR